MVTVAVDTAVVSETWMLTLAVVSLTEMGCAVAKEIDVPPKNVVVPVTP